MVLIVSLFILFVILNVLDCITTVKALHRGCVEKNKCVNFLISKFGSIWVYIKLLFVVLVVGSGILVLCYTSRTTVATIILILCDLFYLYVVVNNIVVMYYQRRNSA